MLFFEIQTGKHKGKRLILVDGQFAIGRDEDVTLRISSAEVSRRHCILHVSGNEVKVEDLDSRNGTFVDGFPIKGTVPLAPGAVLTVGPMTFALVDSNAKPVGRKPVRRGRNGSLSDDDIATWLTENENAAADAGDTTIIPGRVDGPESPSRTPIPPKKKREFKSVAEEAQDIIRRFHEMQGTAPSSGSIE